MTRLSNASLHAVPATVRRPGYDRGAVRPGVVHFGPGAFHRAHQAAAFDTLLESDPRWGITGISLHSPTTAQALNPQDGLYTLALLDAEPELRVIGAIGHVLTGEQPAAILDAIAAPEIRIITTTVTEKGYCLQPDGSLDSRHAAISHDLAGKGAPQSLIGWIVRGLSQRRRGGLPGITILSCDNLAENGCKLGAAVFTFAQQADPETARWIADEVRFPCSMVDSITPATDDSLRLSVRTQLGMEDAWPIQRERFTQWVIEDDFAGERPALECAGVSFAADVRPYEAAKLRLLNGAHSSLAYLGLALGHGTVAEAMADARLSHFAERLMRDDIAPLIAMPPDFNISVYITDILMRFSNPAIAHKLSQIAWDGSQKLPYRLLDSIRDARAAGRPMDRLALPIAAWLRFIANAATTGGSITDPLASVLLSHGADWRAIVAMPAIFGELAADPGFTAAIGHAHAVLADPAGFAR